MNNELLEKNYLLEEPDIEEEGIDICIVKPEEPELPEEPEDFDIPRCEPPCGECGWEDCICWPDEEPEEPEEPEEVDHD